MTISIDDFLACTRYFLPDGWIFAKKWKQSIFQVDGWDGGESDVFSETEEGRGDCLHRNFRMAWECRSSEVFSVIDIKNDPPVEPGDHWGRSSLQAVMLRASSGGFPCRCPAYRCGRRHPHRRSSRQRHRAGCRCAVRRRCRAWRGYEP